MDGELGRAMRGFVAAGVVLLVLSSSAAPVWAQGDEDDEPTFTVDPADLATDAGQWLQQGLTYYDQGNYQAASLLFYRIMTEPSASDGLLYRAEYELAKSLYRMQLFYSALFYFDDIVIQGPDHPFFVHTYPWLLRLARRLPGEPALLERMSNYADFYPDQIEDKDRDQVAYLIGRFNYTRGRLEEAERFLAYVSGASRWYGRAQYLLGVTYIQQYEGQLAADAFGQVIEHVLRLNERSDEDRRLAELAVLSMARTLYSTRDYSGAVAYYDQVPRSSRYWLDALFEKAWALFQLEEYNLALGNLHSLNSPFFSDQFYPEGRVLAAVIFFRNCNFQAVRETVEEFQLDYAPLLDQLEDIVAEMADDEDYFELLLSFTEEREREFSPQLHRILNTALSDRTVREAVDFVNELDREQRAVQASDPGWLNTGLADEVLTQTGLAHSVAANQAGELARIRIRRARDELSNLIDQSEAILVETDLAEQQVISEAVRRELNLSDTGVLPPRRDSEHLLWHFVGEYWRDELGHYWYAIRSRCGELGL